MNKPRGYVCSHRDAYNPETIFSLVPKEFRSRKLMFCGRLDRETEGMVLITDDGNFAQRVTHPSGGVRKHYEVTLTAPLPNAAARQLLGGVNCGGEFLKFDRLVPIGRGTMKNLAFEVVLSQGRKNEIHRALEHFGIFVKRLKRTRMGGLRLRGVAPGRCRPLEHGEIDALFRGSTPVANALPPVPRSPSANGADPSGGRLDGHSPGGCAAKVSAGAPVAKFLPIAGGLRGGRDFLVANGKYGKRFSGNR
jgi:23S rRNA pseudouridine2605 synthase